MQVRLPYRTHELRPQDFGLSLAEFLVVDKLLVLGSDELIDLLAIE